jgi:hypothetical protein
LDTDYYSYATYSSKLYFKPRSLAEAVLLEDIGGQNILHFVCYVVIGCIIFFTIRKVTDTAAFSAKLLQAFYSVASLLMLLPMVNVLFRIVVVNNYLELVTHDRFLFEQEPFTFNELLGPSLVLYLLYFIKRGMQLQDEQALTV